MAGVFDFLFGESAGEKSRREASEASQALAERKFSAQQESEKAKTSSQQADRLIELLDRSDLSQQARRAIGERLSGLPQFKGLSQEPQLPQPPGQPGPSLFDFTKQPTKTSAEQKAMATARLTPEERKKVFFPSLTPKEKELGNVQVIQDPNEPRKFIKVAFTVGPDGSTQMRRLGVAPEAAIKAPTTTISTFVGGKPEVAAQRKELDDLLTFSTNLRNLGKTLKSPETSDDIKAILGPGKGRAIKFAETFGIKSDTKVGKLIKNTGNLFGVQLTDITPGQVKFLATTRNMADTILRLRSGAQINEQEQRRMLTFLPHPLLPRDVYEARRAGLEEYTNEIISQRQATQLRGGIIPQIGAPVDEAHVKLVAHMQTLPLDKFEQVQEAIKRGVETKDIVGAIESGSDLNDLKGKPSTISETVSHVKNANTRGVATVSNAPNERSQPQNLQDKIALQETSKAVKKENGIRVEELLVSHPQSISAMQRLIKEEQMTKDDVGRFLKFIKDRGLTDEQLMQRLKRMGGGQ